MFPTAASTIRFDIDGDADLDIVANSSRSLTVHRKNRNRAFRTTVVLPSNATGRVVEHLLKFDYDLDGDEDALAVCSMGSYGNTVELRKITPSGRV